MSGSRKYPYLFQGFFFLKNLPITRNFQFCFILFLESFGFSDTLLPSSELPMKILVADMDISGTTQCTFNQCIMQNKVPVQGQCGQLNQWYNRKLYMFRTWRSAPCCHGDHHQPAQLLGLLTCPVISAGIFARTPLQMG